MTEYTLSGLLLLIGLLVLINICLLLWSLWLCTQTFTLRRDLIARERWHERELQKWRERL